METTEKSSGVTKKKWVEPLKIPAKNYAEPLKKSVKDSARKNKLTVKMKSSAQYYEKKTKIIEKEKIQGNQKFSQRCFLGKKKKKNY